MLRRCAILVIGFMMLYHVLPIAVFHHHGNAGVHNSACKAAYKHQSHIHGHNEVHCNFCYAAGFITYSTFEAFTTPIPAVHYVYQAYIGVYFTSQSSFGLLHNKAPPTQA